MLLEDDGRGPGGDEGGSEGVFELEVPWWPCVDRENFLR